ncbi:XerC Integrase [uncultured Caudovirales phage]|uniref:Integrase n=1 Tax=uncultured Caudovirales phage TaxID=2100421 RepID=A0A6J5PQ14_9CAUD|nr:XerC Integrase [uncultured Caudovirales phage]CAB4173087.1 XerC Integrase [uncultured Caudovirales phage]CAB4179635.1 XerC Integrase [uncultured Caudovirales phage]CAB4204307.1 XerC Integrase [uncultured Caudovirales phage]CAB4216082.1 XerC Integrase [uncultured Caudovirales phage]
MPRFRKRRRVYKGAGKPRVVYVGIIDDGVDDYGKRQRREKEFPTTAERDAWISSELSGERVERRSKRRAEGATFGELVAAWYAEGETVRSWSPRHAAVTKRLVDSHLAELAPIALKKLRIDHVDKLIAGMVKRGISPHSIRRTRNAISASLNFAIRRRELPPGANFASLVRIPAIPKLEPTFLAPEHIARFFDAIRGQRLEAFFQVSVTLGLRPSEVIGLRWEDVDLESAVVTVRRSTHRVKGGTVDRGTKTGRERTIALPPEIARVLRVHRAAVIEEQLAAPTWKDERRVFTNEHGAAVYQPYVTRQLRAIIDRANATAERDGAPVLPRVTLYQLRHTAATLRLALGEPLEEVQDVLGHTSSDVTRRYARVVEARRKASAARVDDFLRGAGIG